MKLLLASALAGALLAGSVQAAPGAPGSADPLAAHRLGLAYRNGDGVAQDVRLARYWLEVAARAGVADAMFMLAVMLLEGELPLDEAGARRWLELAATEYEHAASWQQLALMEPDPERARQLLRRAAHALDHRPASVNAPFDGAPAPARKD